MSAVVTSIFVVVIFVIVRHEIIKMFNKPKT